MSTFIIAEVGSVHDGSLGNALRLIDAAAECSVDAVKFQTHISEAETLPNAPMPPYFKGEPRYEYFQRTGFTEDQWQQIATHCAEQHVEFLSSPFSIEAVDLLEKIGMQHYKIPSGEVTNLPMLDYIGKTGKHVILSSGMSSWHELDAAVATIRQHHNNLSILQCTTEYPCSYEDVGLNVMLEMRERYNVPVGLSDHTLTTYAPLTAVTLGATIIEKHFTFSRKMYGSDAKHSLEPNELSDMVAGIRAVEKMMTHKVDKSSAGRFQQMKNIFEKSLVSRSEIPVGTVLSADMLAAKKPGTGISAARLNEVIGRITTKPIPANSLIPEDAIEWNE